MSNRLFGSVAILLIGTTMTVAEEAPWTVSDVVLAVHGGTSGKRSGLTEARDRATRADLTRALEAGYAALRQSNGTPLDAVEAAIRVMEDSPEFNAGKGAIFTRTGRNELDASIMEGKTKQAGAVGFVTSIKNPITAARAVMEKTRHVLLVGPGAESFAEKTDLEIVPPEYFRTERRWEQHQRELNEESTQSGIDDVRDVEREPWSTVGAVALDGNGNLAAGTSTGGTSNKLFGRLGDSPIVGAGTYADNESCAVSGTGRGEFFIRWAVAYDIGALMKYQGMSVAQAAEEVIMRKLKPAGGDGGVIALDSQGNFAAPYNTPGMHRGWVTRDGKVHVRLGDEE
jgi:beta-aspartyl-peptidase (threonine type)